MSVISLQHHRTPLGWVSFDIYVLDSQEVDDKVEENVKWKHTEAGQEAYRTLRRLQEKKATVMDIPFPEKLSFRYGHFAQQHPELSRSHDFCPHSLYDARSKRKIFVFANGRE